MTTTAGSDWVGYHFHYPKCGDHSFLALMLFSFVMNSMLILVGNHVLVRPVGRSMFVHAFCLLQAELIQLSRTVSNDPAGGSREYCRLLQDEGLFEDDDKSGGRLGSNSTLASLVLVVASAVWLQDLSRGNTANRFVPDRVKKARTC